MRQTDITPIYLNHKRKLIALLSLFVLAFLSGILSMIRHKNSRHDILDDSLTISEEHNLNEITSPESNAALRGAKVDKQQPLLQNILIVTTDDMTATAIPPYINAKHPMYAINLNPRFNQFLNTATAFSGIAPVTVCGPSRSSFLTGRFPDRTDLYTFQRLIQQVEPSISTVFKYFKDKHNYKAYISGKVFHTLPSDINRDIEYYSGHLSEPRAATATGNSECVGLMYCAKKLKDTADAKVIAAVDKFLASMVNNPGQKFIAGVGFHRPHLTNAIPRKYFKGLNAQIPNYETPAIPGTSDYFHSLAYRDDIDTGNYKIEFSTNSWQKIIDGSRDSTRILFQSKYNTAVKNMIVSYYAGIRYTLDNLGATLNLLDKYGFANNTHVIFMGDHGWQNGERRIIGKNTLYPEATNVPFIIHAAGQTQSYVNPFPVSTRSLYPTLVELIGGADALKQFNDGSGMPLDGVSLVPALNNQTYQSEEFVISQYPRCQRVGTTQVDDCMQGPDNETCQNARRPILFMGYSAITDKYRYVEWRKFIETRTICVSPSWSGMPPELRGIGAPFWQIDPKKTGTDWNSDPIQLELYSVENGQIVTNNLAVNPTSANQDIMKSLSGKIKQKLQNL